jgi:hypothetical protein
MWCMAIIFFATGLIFCYKHIQQSLPGAVEIK